MSGRVVFNLRSEGARRPLPPKILLVRADTETIVHLLLKAFGYLLFFRERLQLEPRFDDEYLPFRPDLAQLDYQGRIALWVECGECTVAKLDRLAVKAPDAEIWAVKRSPAVATELASEMSRGGLRRGRYGIVGLDPALLEEIAGMTSARNDVTWYRSSFVDGRMQFDFNGLWFESEFLVLRH